MGGNEMMSEGGVCVNERLRLCRSLDRKRVWVVYDAAGRSLGLSEARRSTAHPKCGVRAAWGVTWEA